MTKIKTPTGETREADALDHLDFVVSTGDPRKPRCFWSVRSTGDPVFDQVLGRALADEAMPLLVHKDYPFLLGWIVSDMIRAGAAGGVEGGFLWRVQETLRHAARFRNLAMGAPS